MIAPDPDAASVPPQIPPSRYFSLFPGPEQLPDLPQLEVVSGGCDRGAPASRAAPRPIAVVAMEFVSGGKGTLRLGAEEFPLGPGSFYFFRPSDTPQIVSNPQGTIVTYFFHFAGPRIVTLMEALELKTGEVLRSGEPARLTELLDQALDHALKDGPLARRLTSSALEHAIVLGAASRRPGHSDPDPAYATYLRCRQHLERHFMALSSVAAAAQACHLSSAYLTRLFQRHGHETPLTCLNRLKMSEALRQLRLPGSQAKTVAPALGFKSAAHFSRTFKAYHGFTPREALTPFR